MQLKQALSIVIPTLNAARWLPECLKAVRREDAGAEIVVADGGSTDQTLRIAEATSAKIVSAPRGRGVQLAAGISASRHPWLLLLHADTCLAPGWRSAAEAFMAEPENHERAAYFRFALASSALEARRIERWVAWRCRRLGLPYGDQGLLIARDFLDKLGGMRPLVLMEDVDLVRRIGRKRLKELCVPAVTAAERYEREGWRLRSLRNMTCLALYFLGVSPRLIARLYE
ncbi:MAG: TIGR04283 family arsenosugar biosynthesis glycosyltransferase [Acidobacteriia bacterium]|nr:TIGR04283 family arsenosugar biosynthesis glycosyltransferase [Methyloceanibacter sp.]MCL6490719.1 TIGR04283 family arsenosugar biosynthesis glycosyltransferase [Terriglobia bacterium]